ncbi:MAG: hypothetical protein ACRDSO_09790, partial [Pseudonocardiaceae bacterium]
MITISEERAAISAVDPSETTIMNGRRLSLIDSILGKLPPGPAVMISRPPPPAAPKSGHRSDRPCHLKVAGQTYCLRSLERATTTINVPKTLLKCQRLSDQGSRGIAYGWDRRVRLHLPVKITEAVASRGQTLGKVHRRQPPVCGCVRLIRQS